MGVVYYHLENVTAVASSVLDSIDSRSCISFTYNGICLAPLSASGWSRMHAAEHRDLILDRPTTFHWSTGCVRRALIDRARRACRRACVAGLLACLVTCFTDDSNSTWFCDSRYHCSFILPLLLAWEDQLSSQSK